MSTPIYWLASYPRSGNTFLRTIMFQCFGLRSASVYPRDLGKSPELRAAVGHIEHQNGAVVLGDGPIHLVKTHRQRERDWPAIYVVRNGVDATRSLHQFYRGRFALEELIKGHRFGTWAEHVETWNPMERPNTLLLRYEDMRTDIGSTVDRIAEFIRLGPTSRALPPRERLADGKWINADQEKSPLTTEQLALFNSINARAMKAFGYEVGQ